MSVSERALSVHNGGMCSYSKPARAALIWVHAVVRLKETIWKFPLWCDLRGKPCWWETHVHHTSNEYYLLVQCKSRRCSTAARSIFTLYPTLCTYWILWAGANNESAQLNSDYTHTSISIYIYIYFMLFYSILCLWYICVLWDIYSHRKTLHEKVVKAHHHFLCL